MKVAKQHAIVFLVLFIVMMLINPLLSSAFIDGVTFMGSMFSPFNIIIRLAIAAFLSYRYTDRFVELFK